MTELERARAHLSECQGYLSRCRRYGYEIGNIAFHENTVLAALSLVWEEQEKNRLGEWYGREAALHAQFTLIVEHFAFS